MPQFPSEVLSAEEIKSLEQLIVSQAEAEQHDDASKNLFRLRDAQYHQPEVAEALLRLTDQDCLSMSACVEILSEIIEAHHEDDMLMARVGMYSDSARDIDDLNAPPPDEELFQMVVDRLTLVADQYDGHKEAAAIHRGLATSARMLARQCDEIVERSYRKLIELDPKVSSNHYNLGLFCKTRGRFQEGLEANQSAINLSDEEIDSYEWNLGICATGAGQGDVALDVWKRMGQKIEMGRFGLPEGGYPQAKVKLAERPLAERTANKDDPGFEETIWIERLSPCHGIIRSVLYQDLGIDYGDVILFDGAPVTYHTYGDEQIPVFPHLATLVRNNYQFFDFAGTQGETGQLADTSTDLNGDTIVYSHSENYREICANCWRDPDIDHEQHDATEKHIVTGRIAAPADKEPAQLLAQLDEAVASRDPCQLYVPDLCLAAGSQDRASVEQRRFNMLKGN